MRYRALLGTASLAAGLLAVPPAAAATGPAPEVSLLTPVGDPTIGEVLTLTASAANGSTVYYRLDAGAETTPTLIGPLTTAPFRATFTAQYSPTGDPLSIEALTCDDDATPDPVLGCPGQSSVLRVVISRMAPTLTGSPAAFSPNADGKADTAAIAYTLDQPSTALLVVQDMTGHPLGTAPLASTAVAAGAHSATWDGSIRPVAGVAAKRLPQGTYRLSVSNARQLPDSTELGYAAAPRTIRIDTTAKVAVTSNGPVYPRVDRYRDRTTVTVSAGEPGRYKAVIRTSKGKRVRTFSRSIGAAGTGHFRWDGRSSSAHVQKAGKYRATVTFTDAVGNTATASTKLVVKAGR